VKRNFIFIVILFCAVQVFAQNGMIRELSGTVEIKRSGQTGFTAAKAGDQVASDTIISTGFKSTALVVVGNVVLTVRPLTRLSLAEISAAAGTETINVNLQTGRVRVDVDPPAGTRSNTTVRGPTATASVRGTSFEFDTEVLTVIEGTVTFQGPTGTAMLVSAGSSSEITVTGQAADPIDTGAAEFQPPPMAGTESGYREEPTFVRGTFVFDIGKLILQ